MYLLCGGDLVSIIMPSYNSEKYIIKAIESIINQTYQDWELIIVDDYSTDNTVEIINEFLGDERIHFIQNEKNCGAAVSRNRALREARGKWVAFLDSDDSWHPQKLVRQIAFMEENGYKFTFTDYKVQHNGIWLPYIYTGPNIVTKRKLYNYCYLSTLTVMYDRDFIGLIQIPDIRKNNDYAMWLMIIEKSSCYRFPECLSYYTKHDESISSGSKPKLIKWHYILYRKMGRGIFLSTCLTANNLFHGVIKKLVYKKGA